LEESNLICVKIAIELRLQPAKLQFGSKLLDAMHEVVPAATKMRQKLAAYFEQTGANPSLLSTRAAEEELQNQQKKRARIAQVQQLLKQHELLSNTVPSAAAAAAKAPGGTLGTLNW